MLMDILQATLVVLLSRLVFYCEMFQSSVCSSLLRSHTSSPDQQLWWGGVCSRRDVAPVTEWYWETEGPQWPWLLCMCAQTNTHTQWEYIVVTLDQFPGVGCIQIIVHFSAQREGDRELKRREQSENSDARENNRTHQSGTEWKREEKQRLEMRETKENTMFQEQSK